MLFFLSFSQCMSRQSRLCYHAVPRIIETDVACINESQIEDEQSISDVESVDGNNGCKRQRLTTNEANSYDDAFEEHLWNTVIDSKVWKPFFDYVSECRINVNVRQVLENGAQSLSSN